MGRMPVKRIVAKQQTNANTSNQNMPTEEQSFDKYKNKDKNNKKGFFSSFLKRDTSEKASSQQDTQAPLNSKRQALKELRERNRHKQDQLSEEPSSIQEQPAVDITPKQQATTQPNLPDNLKAYPADSNLRYVFLYSNPTIWTPMVKYYSETFKDIVILGTQDITKVLQAFNEKPMAQFLVFFITETAEVDPLLQLLEMLKPSLNFIKVVLLVSNKVSNKDVNKFAVYKVLYKAMPQQLTKGFLNQVMTSVVKSQPIVKDIKPKEPVRPSKAKYTIDEIRSDICNIDLKQLKSTVASIKENILQDTSIESNIQNLIVNSVDIGKDKLVNEIEASLEHTKFLHIVEDQLTAAIKDYEDRGLNNDINNLLLTKIAVNSMRVHEIEEYITNITDKTEDLIKEREQETLRLNESAKRHLTEEIDVEAMQKLRVEIKQNINDLYSELRTLVQLNINANTMLGDVMEESRHLLADANALIDNPKVRAEMVSRSNSLQLKRQQLNSNAAKDSQILTTSFERTRAIMSNYKILVSIDDLLIVNLTEQLEKKNMEIQRLKSDTSNAEFYYAFKNGFSTILNYILDENYFMFYFGGRDAYINKTLLDQSRILTVEDFLAIDWQGDEGTILVDLRDYNSAEHSKDEIDLFLAKFKSICNCYKKVLFYKELEDNIQNSELESTLLESYVTSSHIILPLEESDTQNFLNTAITLKDMLESIKNITKIRFIYNKAVGNYNELCNVYRMLFNRQQSVKQTEIVIPYISTLDRPEPVLTQSHLNTIKQYF